MNGIKELVQKVMDATGLGEKYLQFRLEEFWKEVVPEDVVKDTRSLDFKGDVFTIVVRSSESKDVLDYLSDKLLSRLKKDFPEFSLSAVTVSLDDTQ